MSSTSPVPRLVVLSDNLQVPPRAGDQIHLLSLARAVAPHVPATVVTWAENAPALDAWSRPLAAGTAGPELVAITPSRRAAAGLGRTLRYVREGWRWITAHAPPGSVLWVRRHSTALACWPLMSSRQGRRYRWVYDASSFLRLEYEAGARGRIDLLKAIIEERLWRRFDWIRTLCDPMRDYLVARGVPAVRIRVLPVGAPRPGAYWQAAGLPPRQLLYVGSASPWQGLERLLGAMALVERAVPDLRLTVVGLDADHRLAAGAPGNVTFRGRLPHEAAAAVYREHDLFVLPRPRLALTDRVVPMKLVEAAIVGVPILSTDLAAVRWVTGDEGAWWVDDGGPEVLAAGIEAAVARTEALAALGESARHHAARFTWERVGAEIAAVLGGSRPARAQLSR